MRINRQINKQKKLDIISKIHDRQEARYRKMRDEIKDKSKEELQLLLVAKKHSKTDRFAIIHTIKKIDQVVNESISDITTEHKIDNIIPNDNTENNSTLFREDTNIKEEKS